jgi:hypothetical protein
MANTTAVRPENGNNNVSPESVNRARPLKFEGPRFFLMPYTVRGKRLLHKKSDGFGVRQRVVAFHRRQHVAADRWPFICADLNQKQS